MIITALATALISQIAPISDFSFDLFLLNEPDVELSNLSSPIAWRSEQEQAYSILMNKTAKKSSNWIACQSGVSLYKENKYVNAVSVFSKRDRIDINEMIGSDTKHQFIGYRTYMWDRDSMSSIEFSKNEQKGGKCVGHTVNSIDNQDSLAQSEKVYVINVSTLNNSYSKKEYGSRAMAISSDSAIQTDEYLKRNHPDFKNITLCSWGAKSTNPNILIMPLEGTLKHYIISFRKGAWSAKWMEIIKL